MFKYVSNKKLYMVSKTLSRKLSHESKEYDIAFREGIKFQKTKSKAIASKLKINKKSYKCNIKSRKSI